MMLEGSVPVDHKENDQRKREVYHKKYDAASAVFFQLGLHFLAGSVLSCMQQQEEPHRAKADVVRAE
jgi:hypothetical protein